MHSKTESFEEFEENIFENEQEILSTVEKREPRVREPRLVKSKINNNVATWRKIEDYWDNYKLKQKINDDLYRDEYTDALLDGESN